MRGESVTITFTPSWNTGWAVLWAWLMGGSVSIKFPSARIESTGIQPEALP